MVGRMNTARFISISAGLLRRRSPGVLVFLTSAR